MHIKLLILTFLCVKWTDATKLIIVAKKIEAEPNYDIVNITTQLKLAQNSHKYGIDIEIDLLKPMTDLVMDISVTYSVKRGPGFLKEITLYNRSSSICKEIKMKQPSFIKRFDEILKYGNFPDKCPIKEGYYFLHDFSLFEGILPKYYPRGDFVIKTIFKTVQDKQLVMFVKLVFFGEILQV